MKRTWIHSVLALALALTMIFAVAVQSFAEHDYRYDDSTVWDLIEVTVGNVEDDIGDGNFTAVPEDVLWGVDQTNIMFKQAINGPQADVKKPGKKIKKYLKSHASSTSVTVPRILYAKTSLYLESAISEQVYGQDQILDLLHQKNHIVLIPMLVVAMPDGSLRVRFNFESTYQDRDLRVDQISFIRLKTLDGTILAEGYPEKFNVPGYLERGTPQKNSSGKTTYNGEVTMCTLDFQPGTYNPDILMTSGLDTSIKVSGKSVNLGN